jgi:hypothetical protein
MVDSSHHLFVHGAVPSEFRSFDDFAAATVAFETKGRGR